MELRDKIKKIDPWYALFWIGMAGIFVWAVLKSFEIIKSPPWQEMIPVFSAIVAGVGIAKYVVKYVVKIEVMDIRLIRVELDVKELEKDMKEVKDQRLVKIEKHLGI